MQPMSTDRPTAIVTAAGRGIGAACARALAERGYVVSLMSTSGAAETLATELGGMGLTGSVTEPDDLKRLVDNTWDAHGRIDAVINNTGHVGKGTLLEISDDAWHDGVDMLLLNVIRATRYITPRMLERGGGAIVNISSFAARQPDPRFVISSTIRAGLSAFARMFATEYAESGIRMNNVLPGFVDSFPVDESVCKTIPAGRYASVAEIGQAVAFLVSPESAYITGQDLVVDGGLISNT